MTTNIKEETYINVSGGETIDTIDITDSGITAGVFDVDYQIDLSSLTGALTGAIGASSTISSNYGNLAAAVSNYGNITIGSGSTLGPYTYNTTANWDNSINGKIKCNGDDADVVINGKSLSEFMTKMEQRMAILVPDPEKLEHFEALQKAYAHYKTLEALCEIPKPTEEE